MRTNLAVWSCVLFTSVVLGVGVAMADEPSGGWRVVLSATATGVRDQGSLTVGAASGTLDGFDPYDDPHPPALPSRFVDVITHHEASEMGWEDQPMSVMRYRAEFVAEFGDNSHTIPFLVQTDQARTIDLNWVLVPDVELAHHFITLHDLESGTSMEMWETGTYLFVHAGGAHRFELVFTPGRSEGSPPEADFTHSVQPGLIVSFTDASTDPDGDITAWSWQFGDGTSGLEQNPVHTYHSKGTKAITLTVTDSMGNSASQTKFLVVASPPLAAFTFDPAGPVTGGEVRFADASSDADGEIVAWSWSFGDGGASAERDPRHVYSYPGNFNATLVVTDDDGSTGAVTLPIIVDIADLGTAPIALFRPDLPARDVAATANGGLVVDSSGAPLGHEPFQMLDDYVGTPWATDGVSGQFATIQISSGAPILIDTVQIQPRNDGYFDQRVKDFSVDISTTGWSSTDFMPVLTGTCNNDGTLQSFSLPPQTTARYVRYRPLTSQGSNPWHISTSKFKVLSQWSGPRVVPFVNLSTGAVSYEWTFGDTGTSIQTNPTHAFADVGLHTVTLVARAADGRVCTLARQYQARGPVANFEVRPVVPIAGEPATFRSTSAFPTASPAIWSWTFGDGATTTSANVLHTYAAAGIYTATLNVIDREGYASTTSRTVTVVDSSAGLPRALFNPRSRGKNVALAEAGASIMASSGQWDASYPAATAIDLDSGNSYWATPSGTPTNGWVTIALTGTRLWRIDRVRIAGSGSNSRVKDFQVLVSVDGTTDADFTPVLSAQNPNDISLHEYMLPAPVPARYVMIRALNNWGSSSCISIQQIRVLTGPDLQRGRNVALSETGATIQSYSSQWPDATRPVSTLIDALPTNSYWGSANGQTSSWVKIDLGGDELRQLDLIRLVPAGGDQRVRDFQVLVSPASAADPDFTLAFQGTAPNSDQGFDIPLDPPLAGNFVMLRCLNNRGNPSSVAAAQLKAFTGQEDGPTVTFENLTRGADSYLWDFGDGQSSSESEPTHTFPGPGTYTVTLTATNANGSSYYSLDQVVRVATISFKPASPEAQQQVDFKDVSPAELGVNRWAWDLGDGHTSIFKEPVNTYSEQGIYAVTLGATDVEGNSLRATTTIEVGAPSFKAAFNARNGLNVASLENGASVMAYSSQYDSSTWDAAKLLDARNDTAWHSSSNPPVNSKWIKFSMAGSEEYSIDRLLLLGRQDGYFEEHPRDFAIAVSTTGIADADFRTVLVATMPPNQSQPVLFRLPRPVQARYVLYRAFNSQSSNVVTTAALRAQSGQVNTRTVVFDDLTVGGVAPRSYQWTFGDGGVSTEASPTHTFPVSGLYDVTLTVTDANAATSTTTMRHRIIDAKLASFTLSPAEPTEARAVTFTDQTASPSDAAIALRRWSWGDGTPDTVTTGATATHTFADNGTYSVSLQVTDTWQQVVAVIRPVLVSNVPPVVNVGPDWRWRQERALTVAPAYSDVASNADPLTCTWSYGDGTADAAGCSFSHAYADTGTYTATLTVSDGDGGVTSDSFEVEVIEKERPQEPGSGAGGAGVGKAATDYTYSLDADFDLGTMLNVNHDAPANDQLQLNSEVKPFPFVYIACSGRGTAVRIDVNSGAILGEFRTAPENREKNPSRTTVDKLGNVWVANRDESEYRTIGGETTYWGSATRIGLIVGGTRTNADGTANAAGEYLLPPFEYNTCVDKDGDGLIRTSRGLGNILAWPNADSIDSDGGVETADDECIQLYVRVHGTNTRTVAIDANNDVWIGGANTWHEKVDGVTGQRVPGTAFNLGCGGYGGLIDGNGVLWSSRFGNGLLRYDTGAAIGVCLGNSHGDYGLGIDPATGNIWHTTYTGRAVVKLNPAATAPGTVELGRYYHGNDMAQGTAVDSKGSVWVAHTGGTTHVGRVRTDGLFLGNAFLGPNGSGPTGVAIDANGKVWSANMSSSTASRIDPKIGQKIAGMVPSGWYDLVIHLGANASPYNYSDMTGAVAIGVTSPSGFWSIQQDGTASGMIWRSITWNGAAPAGTSITVEARAADNQAELPSRAFSAVVSGTELAGMVGRFIEVRVTLQTGDRDTSPIFTDIRITGDVPPEAADRSVTTPKDTPVAVALTASDANRDPLTYAVVSQPAHGTLSGAAPSLTYTPEPAYTGPDSFTFTASDGTADSNLATVSITVTPPTGMPPVANDQSVATLEDTPLAVALTAADADGDPLTFAVVSTPAYGTLSGTAPDLTYTPEPGYSGPDAFTFTANDGSADSNAATVSITVTPVNDPPVADDQSVTTPEDTPLAVTLTASDSDGEPMTYAVASQPAHGMLSGAAPDVTYSPTPDYHGPDSFTFTAHDGTIGSNTATVLITVTPVNDLPVAHDQSVTTPEDTPLAIALAASDVDGDSLTFSLVSQPAHGTLSGTAPDLTYTPAGGYNGPDSFTFLANDATVESNTATVSITVTPVNDPPVADDQSVTTPEDTPLAVTLTASDPDGDPVTYAVVRQPARGTLAGTVPNLTYTPIAGYSGPDSLTFLANDGAIDSNVATVLITVTPVNDPPVANDQSVATPEDTSAVITLTASDIDRDPLTYVVVGQPTHGTLSGTAPHLTYTPAAGYYGPDVLSFTANDGTTDSDTATVSITVTPVNDPPLAHDQAVTTLEDTPLAITLTASDADDNPLTYRIVSIPTHGMLSGDPPVLIYTPAPDYDGLDSFTFAANDGIADSTTATVAITVTPVNDPPLANGQSATTPEGTPLAITLTAADADGDPLTYALVLQPEYGELTGAAPDLTYTPVASYCGSDSLTFKVSDGTIDSNTAMVWITITPVNDPPVAFNQTLMTPASTALAITLAATDVDGDPLTYWVVSRPLHGTLTGTAPDLTYTPDAGYSGSDSFTFTANDGWLDSNLATVAIDAGGSNTSPTCTDAKLVYSRLWPPNHKMRKVSIAGVVDPNGDRVTILATGVRQDEPVNDKGDGTTAADAILEPLQLRWERSGTGTGRVYHITFTASDGRGGACSGSVQVCVPHDQGKQEDNCINEGPLFDSTATGGR